MDTPENQRWTDGRKNGCQACYLSVQRQRSTDRRASRRQALADAGAVPRFSETDPMVYFVSDAHGHVKIGVTANVPMRFASLQGAHAEELRIEALAKGGYPTEKRLHEQFAGARIQGEWFELTPEIAYYIDICREVIPCT